MTDAKTTIAMSTADVLKGMEHIDPKLDYVWDGKAEDDRPASAQELEEAVSARRRDRALGKSR